MNERTGTMMRLSGQFEAALRIVEGCKVDFDDRHLNDLKRTAEDALRKAMLQAWRQAETVPAVQEGK